VGTRDGHNEYMCQQCGHPLLFEIDRDPYAPDGLFGKRVRYLCNLFGHRSHVVVERSGLTEYACGCGHTFLREARGLSRVTHPPICTVLGHFVRFVERRSGYSEHACLNCGHTFGFATPPTAGQPLELTHPKILAHAAAD
jgi:DNA-directed RNA polymerase subunit RPC12/RpoP